MNRVSENLFWIIQSHDLDSSHVVGNLELTSHSSVYLSTTSSFPRPEPEKVVFNYVCAKLA